MTSKPEAVSQGPILSRRTALGLGAAAGAAALLATAAPPVLDWLDSFADSPEAQLSPEELWNECNTGSGNLDRREELIPYLNADGTPDFMRSMESIQAWGGIGKNKNGERTPTLCIIEDSLEEDIVQLTSDNPEIHAFPKTQLKETHIPKEYVQVESAEGTIFTLKRNNFRREDYVSFQNDFHESIKLWENDEAPNINPETRYILNQLKERYNPNVQIATTEGLFTHTSQTFGETYAYTQETYSREALQSKFNRYYKHSFNTLAALAYGLPPEANVLQMGSNDLTNFINNRAEAIQLGARPPFTAIYYPYGYHRNEETIHKALEGKDIDKLGIVIVVSTGNEGEVTPINQEIPKGVFCITSLNHEGQLRDNRNMVTGPTADRLYALEERLPSLDVYPAVHKAVDDELSLRLVVTRSNTEGTSYSGLKATMILALLASERASKGLPLNATSLEEDMKAVTRNKQVQKNGQTFAVRELDIEALKHRNV